MSKIKRHEVCSCQTEKLDEWSDWRISVLKFSLPRCDVGGATATQEGPDGLAKPMLFTIIFYVHVCILIYMLMCTNYYISVNLRFKILKLYCLEPVEGDDGLQLNYNFDKITYKTR